MPPCTLTEKRRTEGGEAELSSYEDYTRKSGNYDKTREPVGTEILIGCFAHAPVPLDRTVILDAGCGTGSYSEALLRYVGRIEAVDLNPGMLEVAASKLAWAGDRVSFHSSRIDELPFEDAALDGVMINQVLHHLPDDPADGFPAHRGVFAPIDATVQGDAYFDPRGPLSKEWRDGDSVWSLVAEGRLNRALSRIRMLDERGELEAYVARNDAPRAHMGQVTVFFASRT